MTRVAMLLGAGLIAGACMGLTSSAVAAPLMIGGPAIASRLTADALPVEKVQVRRRAGGGRVVGAAPYRGGYYRGGYYRGRGGLSTGAAVGLGVGAAALGILGAAAAANAAPSYYYAPAPVYGGYGYGGYGGCYIARQPVYDDWGNYIGSQRVRVCD